MPRRKTVSVNLNKILYHIKMQCRNNTAFCEKMGRSGKWVSDWKRRKNLPSPEEAAQMCAILQVTPEEILTEPEDIELVRALFDSQRPGDGQKNTAPMDGSGLRPIQKEAWDMVLKMSDEEVERFIRVAKAIKGE